MQLLDLKELSSIYHNTFLQEKSMGSGLKTDAWHYEQCCDVFDVIALIRCVNYRILIDSWRDREVSLRSLPHQ